MCESLRDIQSLAKSFIPSERLIASGDTLALFEKTYSPDAIVRAIRLAGLTFSVMNDEINGVKSDISCFGFGPICLTPDDTPLIGAEFQAPTTTIQEIERGGALMLSFYGNISDLRTLPENMARTVHFLNESGMGKLWPYMFGFTHLTMAKMCEKRGFEVHPLSKPPKYARKYLKAMSTAVQLAEPIANPRSTPQFFGVSIKTAEFIDRFSKRGATYSTTR